MAPVGYARFDQPAYKAGYDSAYVTALASATATYSSTWNAALVAAGQTAPNAAAIAANGCTYIGRSDAREQGFDAGSAATTWIEVGAYGSGAKPVFDGTGTTLSGLRFPSTSYGGFYVNNIAFKNFTTAGIDRTGYDLTVGMGYRFEDCDFTDITGMPGPPPAQPQAGYNEIAATGIWCQRATHVRIARCTFTRCEHGYVLNTPVCGLVIDCDHTDTKKDFCGFGEIGGSPVAQNVGPTTFSDCAEITIRGGTIANTGTVGSASGTTGIILAGPTDMMVRDVEITGTQNVSNPTVDAIALDFEGQNRRTMILDCNFHDNKGSTFLMFQSVFSGTPSQAMSGTFIVNNTFASNGLQNPASYPLLARANTTASDQVTWLGNSGARAAPGQKLFSTAAYGSPSDTPQAGWIFGPDNVFT